MLLAAFRGREAEAVALIEAAIDEATAGGQGIGVQYAHWAAAILFNGLGRYERGAGRGAEQASDDTPELFLSAWALPELIEASVRSGQTRARRGRARAPGATPRPPPARTGRSGSRPARARC